MKITNLLSHGSLLNRVDQEQSDPLKAMQAVLGNDPGLLRDGFQPRTILPLKSVHTSLLININDFTLL